MDPHLTTSPASVGARTEVDALRPLAHRSETASDSNTRKQAARNAPGLTLRSVSSRTHTLVLTGELTHRSASTLEVEIERLCEEGVSGITLDLRQLTHIDATGVAVISFRCGFCERQGCGFALIPGSRFIHRAFERAGVTDSLPFQENDVAVQRLHA
jgi:anti-anti-sigma factor